MAPMTQRERPHPASGAPSQPTWAATVPSPRDPLPAAVEAFLDHLRIERNRPMTTVRAYRQDLAKLVAFLRANGRELGERTRVERILDRALLRRYQLELAAVLPNPRSRARALVAVRRFLAHGYDEGWCSEDLSRAIAVPRYVVGDPHPVPTEVVPVLLGALPHRTLLDLRDRALVHFLLATGCRISEACSVDARDVRPEGFRVLGKGGKYRTVYLTIAAWRAIQEYRAQRNDTSPALFISLARGDMLDGRATRDNRLTPAGARHALRALHRRAMASAPDLYDALAHLRSPHSARHTAATTLLEATDGDVRLVQEVLGHATLETLRVYTEITDQRKQAAYRRLGDYLDEVRDT